MSARLLFAIGVALLAISVPTAQGCNIVADRDAATRMATSSTGRDVISVKRTAKLHPASPSVSALASYPR